MTTVEVRSYSRNSGRIWWEMESGTASELSASATANSFLGFAKEKRSEMAMDCGFAAETCSAGEFAFVGDFAEGFDDGLGGIGWRGENFEHAQATCVDPDAVGKGAAGVDGDAEWLGAAGHGDSGILG